MTSSLAPSDTTPRGANSKLTLLKEFQLSENRPHGARISEDPLAHAFEEKAVVHAGLGGRPMPRKALPGLWADLSARPREGKTSAYVHIPFCQTQCLYCGFYANALKADAVQAYARALMEEIRADRDLPVVNSGPVHAVYLGGGTPTGLSARDLRELLTTLKECLPLSNDCEITVEGRILNFDEEKMDACLEGGANRFSIGVQSFDSRIRQKLGRWADQQTIVDRLNLLKSKDQAAVIIDLIFGLPGQTMDHWEADLKQFLEMELDGVDLYQLITFKGGPLDRAVARGKIGPAADKFQRSRMFKRGVEIMEDARYRRLSICHWGRAFRERNIYNLSMKQKTHCLAYGSGAGGNLFGHMYFLDGTLDAYLGKAGREKPLLHAMAPSPHEAVNRFIAGELERGRIRLGDLEKFWDPAMGQDLDPETFFAPLVENWAAAGLITLDRGWMDLTLAGQFWETTMAQGMIDYFNGARAALA